MHLDFFRERIIALQFARFDLNDVDMSVHAGTLCQLDIAFVPEDELRLGFSLTHPFSLAVFEMLTILIVQPQFFAVRPFQRVFKGDHVKLAKLRAGRKVQRFSQQRRGKDGTGITILQARVDGYNG